MSERTIPGGPGEIQVYLSDAGFVCIKQMDYPSDEAVVVVRRDDVPDLIDHVRATYQEALDYVPPTKDA